MPSDVLYISKVRGGGRAVMPSLHQRTECLLLLIRICYLGPKPF